MDCWHLVVSGLITLLPGFGAFAQEGLIATGGGHGPRETGPCISAKEEASIRSQIADFSARHPGAIALAAPAGTTPYPFFPQAGKLWEDVFPNNFVDLDSTSPGVLDYHGTDYTYDGHHGIDTLLFTFTEQSIGVPIFAALDGTVVAAHDGEPDMNTTQNNVPANYVVLNNGGTHETWYYHMKKNSVLVTVGQTVKSGQQLGLTASSGFSNWPHLHFESRSAGTYFEPFTGPSNLGASGWVNQIPFKTTMAVGDFNLTTQDLSTWPGPPIDTTRTGTLVGTGVKTINFWTVLYNLPASSTWRVRFLRPDGTVRYNSNVNAFGSGSEPFYRWSYWTWNYNINFDVTGTWTVEFRVNGTVVVQAPLTITSATATNRPPVDVTPAFDPPVGYASKAIFCRVPFHIIDDPDYDVVRYRYLWKRNGTVIRDSTNASLADAIPAGACLPGDALTCTVTPSDGVATGTPVTVSMTPRQTFGEWAASKGIPGAAATEDNDTDGLKNIVEFVLNTSPSIRTTLSPPTRNAAGVVRWQVIPNSALDPAVTFVVESTVNLVDWLPAAFDSATNTWSAGTLADTTRFMRLRVTSP